MGGEFFRTKAAWIFAAIAVWAGIIAGCGSSGSSTQGPEGSWGGEQTNTTVSADLRTASYQVDVCNGSSATAIANIVTATINPKLPANTLYMEGYTIEYSTSASGAPPVSSKTYGHSQTLSAYDLTVNFVDTAAKQRWLIDTTTGGYAPADTYPLYTAKYTFFGHDKFGTSFGTVSSITFNMGRYTVCKITMAPSSISLSGVNNPDATASDDVTFNLSGGVPPYTVYSNNASVIAAPGSLASGINSFTIDPNGVAASTAVTLTAVDAIGTTGTATVTVTP